MNVLLGLCFGVLLYDVCATWFEPMVHFATVVMPQSMRWYLSHVLESAPLGIKMNAPLNSFLVAFIQETTVHWQSSLEWAFASLLHVGHHFPLPACALFGCLLGLRMSLALVCDCVIFLFLPLRMLAFLFSHLFTVYVAGLRTFARLLTGS